MNTFYKTTHSFLLVAFILLQGSVRGWKFITPVEAYQDQIASYRIENPLKYNPGRIGDIARDKRQKKGLWHKTLDEKYLETVFCQQVLESPEIN